ncbi:MAG TPA: SRPBCC family protein [Kofleriaceae bacterium]
MFKRKSSVGRWIGLGIGVGAVAGLGYLALTRTKRVIAHIGPVTGTVTINRTPDEVYAFFRDFSQLPSFMTYLEKVEVNGLSSTWTALNGYATWEAIITEDVPGKKIAWKTVDDSSISMTGVVRFDRAPGRDATEIRCEIQLGVGGLPPSRALARFLATPEVKGDLRRLKQVLETGEVLISDASAHVKPHAAQPSDDAKPAPPLFIRNEPTAQKGVSPVPHAQVEPKGTTINRGAPDVKGVV